MSIRIEAESLLQKLGENGEHWIKRAWSSPKGGMCLHQAIKMCILVPGDFYLLLRVAKRQGWGPHWNDNANVSWIDIRTKINGGIEVSDTDLEVTYGPQWREIVALVRRAATLTADEALSLASSLEAPRGAARKAIQRAAWEAVFQSTWLAAGETAFDAAGYVAWEAAGALSMRHLIGEHGFTQEHYDILTGPWATVIGKVHPDDKALGE